jgi:hypothetical protein
MKQIEGRDWLDLSESVFSLHGDKFRISDSSASIHLTEEDIKRIVKLVTTKLKEKNT